MVIGQLASGTIVAGYEIQSALGRGGMGDVYLARRDGETRSVALKLLSVGLARDTRFRERFERESHLATSLEHPHIVPVYATGEVEGVRYIAMRYVDGPTLRELIDDESPLGLRRVLALLDQIASALDDAHGIGLVHRDIKPGNILIARSGASEFREHAYLTDFGVSKYTGSESDFTRTGQFVGTTLYAAPEQIKGERVDGRTDVYAFGCVLFECLTGRVPFEKESEAALLWAQMIEEPVPVTSLRSDLPVALDAVVAKAMAKEPDERYSTCGALVTDARASIEEQPSPPVARTLAAATVIRPEQEPEHDVPAGATLAGSVLSTEAPNVATIAAVSMPAVEIPVGLVEDRTASDTAASDPAGKTAAVQEVERARDEPAAQAVVVRPAEASVEAAVGAPVVTDPRDSRRDTAPTVIEEPSAYASEASRAEAPRRSRLILVLAGIALLGAAAVAVFVLRDGGGGSAAPAPSSTSRPKIEGVARAGSTLTASRGSWSGAPTEFTYQWRRCGRGGAACAAVSGAKSPKYRITADDVGSRLSVAVTAATAEGARTSRSRATPVVTPALVEPSNVAPPTLSGTAQEGSTLDASEGRWRGTKPISYAYTWQRCAVTGGECVTIEGSRRTTYTLQSQDVDHTIRVVERASNKAGRATASSKATPIVQARPTSTGPSTTETPPTTGPIQTVPEPQDP